MKIQIILIAIFLISASACKSSKETEASTEAIPVVDEEGHQEAYMEELEQLKKEIEATVETMNGSSACGEDSPCVAIAFGAKPCGGPWEYLIVPSSVDYLGPLMEKVSGYNELEKEINEQFGLSSDCMFVEEPEVICKDGKCQAKK